MDSKNHIVVHVISYISVTVFIALFCVYVGYWFYSCVNQIFLLIRRREQDQNIEMATYEEGNSQNDDDA